MAVDVFLKLGDIKGESKDDKHTGEIDVLSWSWGVVADRHHGGTAAAAAPARRTSSDLNFMHALDKASPVLMTTCATGEHIKEATLMSRKAGKGQQEYLIIKMNDILVTSVQPSGSSEHPMESVSMQFREDRPGVQAAEGRRLARRRACTSSTTSRQNKEG